MNNEKYFSFDKSNPLLPQIRGAISEKKDAGEDFDTLFLEPDDYLVALSEMKQEKGRPPCVPGLTVIIGRIGGCQAEMGMLVDEHEQP